jgi:hypothetical protein
METKVVFLCQKTPFGYLAKDWSGQGGKGVAYSIPYPTHQAMKLILALLAGLALAAYILALADGPNLFDILNNY